MTHYVSRTAIETDWRCPRARYYMTVFGERGIVPANRDEPLHFGAAVHHGLQMSTLDRAWIRTSSGLTFEQLAKVTSPDYVALAQGFLWGFNLIVLPRIEEKYKILHIEQELEYELAPGIVMLLQPDLLVQDREQGTYGYIEYKTSKWNTVGAMTHFAKAIQLHFGLEAATAMTGLPFEWAMVQAFHKAEPHQKSKRLMSPLVWAYTARVGGKNIYSLEWKRDWEPFFTPSYKGPEGQGVEGWIRFLIATDAVRLIKGEDALSSCFPVTAPVFPDRNLIEPARKQILYRERDIVDYIGEADLDRTFPQHFSACQRGKYRCAYYEACHQFHGDEQAIAQSDLFVQRDPHHATEAFALDLEEEAF